MIDNSPNPWESLLKKRNYENIGNTVEKLIATNNANVDLRWVLDSSDRCGIKAYFSSISRQTLDNAPSWDDDHQEISISFSPPEYLPKLNITISLNNHSYLTIFYYYCCSLVAKTDEVASSSDLFNVILNTVNEWSEFFKKANSTKLSFIQQKGLIGELCFLSYFIDKKGADSALASWKGPIKSSKDFVLDNIAYEVKCCEPNLASEKIKISSLDQLLVKPYKILHLVIYEIAPSSPQSDQSFTLEELITVIYEKLGFENRHNLSIFNQLLADYGCENIHDYNEYIWNILEGSPRIFIVDNQFPALTSNNVPSGIIDASYSISLSHIRKHNNQILLEDI